MQYKIEGTGKIHLENIKRLYVDTVITTTCDKCGQECSLNLVDDYISYGGNIIFSYCNHCEEEFDKPLIFTYEAKVVFHLVEEEV